MLAIVEPQDGQTLTVAAGATAFTIAAAIFQFLDVQPGDRLCAAGVGMIIRSVDPDSGNGVLLQGWPGPAQTAATDWYIEQSQASRQSFVASTEQVATANSWLARILSQSTPWAVLDRVSAPPAGPVEGDTYLASPTAADGFQPNLIYRYQSAAWVPVPPHKGDIVFIVASRQTMGWDGTAWGAVSPAAGAVGTSSLADAAVTNAKLADMAAGTIKLRALGAGSGPPVDGTPAQARALLGFPAPGEPISLADGGTGASTVAAAGVALGINAGNLIINGRFVINQRCYTSGSPRAAGAYAHDRWKAGSGGCTYTFAQLATSTQITIAAGTLLQIVEGANIDGGTYIVSWTGTAQARVYQGAGSGAYGKSPLTVTNLSAGSNTTIEFGMGTLASVQMQAGGVASPIAPRLVGQELALCQRYYERSYASGVASGTGSYQVGYHSALIGNYANVAMTIPFQVSKRAVPTVSVYSPYSGAIGKISDGGNVESSITFLTWNEFSAAFYAGGLTANSYAYAHFVADADF